MSDPAFLQFADLCEQQKRAWTVAPNVYQLGPKGQQELVKDYAQAERHARLLAAVWEWTNSLSGTLRKSECKAHVRALLAQSEEQER